MENNEQSDNERNGTIRGYFAFKSKGEWQTNRHRRWELFINLKIKRHGKYIYVVSY